MYISSNIREYVCFILKHVVMLLLLHMFPSENLISIEMSNQFICLINWLVLRYFYPIYLSHPILTLFKLTIITCSPLHLFACLQHILQITTRLLKRSRNMTLTSRRRLVMTTVSDIGFPITTHKSPVYRNC